MTPRRAAELETGPRSTPPPAPYANLAPHYDGLVGDAQHAVIATSFDECVRRQRIRFGSAADAGCGTGVFLRHLLRYRVPLFGVDRSPDMLRIAARRLPHDGVRLLCQDLDSMMLPRPVDLITCNGDTLNYFIDPAALARALTAMAKNLSVGGHLVGDLLTGTPVPPPQRRLQLEHLGVETRWRCEVDSARRLTLVELAVRDGPAGTGRWSIERHLQRWFTPAELRRALASAGLALVASFPLARPSPDAAWCKLVARR